MALISDGAILLENGQTVRFESIHPVKILYPFVLMDDLTVFNLIYEKFITTDDGKCVDNTNDIFYSHIYGCTGKSCIAFFVKLKNDTIHFLNHNSNIISSNYFYEGKQNINNIYALHDGILLTKILIYTSDDKLILKNYLERIIIDDNCSHIVTNISDSWLEISLLKNDNIKVYTIDLDTNLLVLKKEIGLDFNVHKIFRQYLIDMSGKLYFVDIPNYKQISITEIKTEYKICDMMPIDYSLDSFLLLSWDGKIIRYNSINNEMLILNLSGSFSLNYVGTKSAKKIFIQS